MKISTQRAIDRWAGQVLCALLSLWAALMQRLGGTALKTALPIGGAGQPPRVLVILLSEMGSVVLATAMFDEIKRLHPGADIHVLQLKKNQGVMKLLGFVPEANLHSLDDSSLGSLLRDIWQTSRRFRALPLDGVIDCELFSRISALLSYFCGARIRVGFTPHTQEGLYRGSFLNCPVPYNTYQHIGLQFVGLARVLSQGLGAQHTQAVARPLNRLVLPKLQSALPELPVDAAQLAAFQARLRADFTPLNAVQPKPLVLLYASGGALPIRAWPEGNYTQLTLDLLGKGCVVGLIGLPEDKPQAQRVLAAVQSQACLDLTGYTRNLSELLLLFHSAQLLVTNDGGPGHFASLTPIPSIVFFGPETGRLYGPISPRASVLESGMACSPCLTAYNHRDSFCDGDNQCLKVITNATVLNLALDKLGLRA